MCICQTVYIFWLVEPTEIVETDLNNERLVFEFLIKIILLQFLFTQRQGWRTERVKPNESNDA